MPTPYMTELYTELIKNLKKCFGKYDEEHHRFEKTSNSEVARELGYSDAQFSRLINGSATEGEYQRANQNIKRILYINELEEELSISKKGLSFRKKKRTWLVIAFTFLISLTLIAIVYWVINANNETQIATQKRDSTLKWAFENAYIKPYTKLNSLPGDCNFPCYKYQGKWALKESYKLPFFREQNGYHYVATEVNMYARCKGEEAENGELFEGYEYQKHEIWYDKKERTVDSFVLNSGELTNDYKELVLAESKDFVKVAIVHTLFRNDFTIQNDFVSREGRVIGRDVEVIKDQALSELIPSSEKASKIKSEVNNIARVRLEDFSRPISCQNARVPSIDFNLIKDGDELSFSCKLTTSRLSLDYGKTYVLADQYIKNTCHTLEE
jgi:hypothetical protein